MITRKKMTRMAKLAENRTVARELANDVIGWLVSLGQDEYDGVKELPSSDTLGKELAERILAGLNKRDGIAGIGDDQA